ncbi:ARF-binding protein [Sporothrix eucalyptigena]|uniref:ARF-binding protein n=1 Tax=Sporothrix eucalyptigena TaxID=1812306 RepID=A0ABP0BC52_9PEZI
MEASSARYAARDRWNEAAYPAPSQLQRFIQSACSPENYEPNLALNLEIADLINSKKGSAPREAATTIVGYVNHRNANVALLALNLLDICVKNCGYPFHLQISTKEFLNELVRRFPERPPPRPTRVQTKILGAIEEWRGTICETSRYKEDLGFIRDMHRLLSYKGYTFPEVRREDAAVLNPSDNLKSAEEMEEEEREAQSAKLQELIRRGTPEDLQEANRLMKVMAGYDTRTKVDYRAKAAEEVAKIQQKARLLEERLASFQPGEDSMKDGDVFDELASALSSAQPKIQKMCEEESDDHEAVARLLEINDSIHRTVERYKLLKKGDVEGAHKLAQGAPISTASKTSAVQELSLIDFDGDGVSSSDPQATDGGHLASSSSAAPASKSTGIENDLLGLSFNEPVTGYGQSAPGGIALGFGANNNVPGPALLSSVSQHSSARGVMGTPSPSASPLPSSASVGSAPSTAALPSDAFSSLFSTSTVAASSNSGTPQPNYQSSAFAPPKPASADPFAALASPRFHSPASASAAPAAPAAAPAPTAAADDDEWSFSSALPTETTPAKPKEHRAIISNGPVKIDLYATRAPASPAPIQFAFAFSNTTSQPVVDLHFQTAVTKGFELKLQPQSGRNLDPLQTRGVQQIMEVSYANDKSRRVETIKLRWRLAYKVGEETRTDQGEVHEFELA